MKERPILFSAPMVRAILEGRKTQTRRVELRHGTLALVRATFKGFRSLPAPPGEDWWVVLEVPQSASLEVIEAAYKRLRSKHHPDRGGDPEQFQRVQRAYEQATQ